MTQKQSGGCVSSNVVQGPFESEEDRDIMNFLALVNPACKNMTREDRAKALAWIKGETKKGKKAKERTKPSGPTS
jgi:hypothetical protein